MSDSGTTRARALRTLSEDARAEFDALGLDENGGRIVGRGSGLDPVSGRPAIPKHAIRAPEVLNEAYDYGKPSSFSRGLRVELPGATMLFLSGTASVDEQGRTVYDGDFEAQCLRTFRNLTRLLVAEKASWHDIVRTTCYLRDIERDYDSFNEVRTMFLQAIGLDPLPASTAIQARICRSDLLVEIEAIAIVPPAVSRVVRITIRLLCAALLLGGALASGRGPAAAEKSTGPTTQTMEAPERRGDSEEPRYGNTPAELVPYGKSDEPYRRFYQTPLAFRGPGRDAPDPEGLEAVRIGLIAPIEGGGDDRPGPDLLRGARLAIEEANRSGGYRGVPFELVPRNDQALWGSSSNTLVELAYKERVFALIGSIDSNSTHVALRAALKAELPIVNVGSTDPTMTETGIPWIVRVTPDDRQTSYRLARLIFEERGLSRVAIVRSSDRYGRFGVKEFRDAARRLGRPVPMEILVRVDQHDVGAQLERLRDSGIEAILLWTPPEIGGRIARQLRASGLRVPLFGTDQLAAPQFLEQAGPAAEGSEMTCWINPGRSDGAWVNFRDRFRRRFDRDPGPYATYAYDAANLVVSAIRQRGLNRARIRDQLLGLRSYTGVAGIVTLDRTSNSVTPPLLARIEGGRLVFE